MSARLYNASGDRGLNETEQIQRVEVFRVAAQDFPAKPGGLIAISCPMRAPRILDQDVAHDAIASTAKCAGGSPLCWRSSIVVKADSKWRVNRTVSKRGCLSRFEASLALIAFSAAPSRANFKAKAS